MAERAARLDRLLQCRHFGTCGGCTLLDVPIVDQLRAKAGRVLEQCGPTLDGVELEWQPPPRVPYYTRTKLIYPIRPGRDDRATMGLFRRGTHELIELEQCRIQDRALTTLGRRALRVIRDSELEPYDEVGHTGVLRAFHARLMPGTGELMIGLTTTGGVHPGLEPLAGALLDCSAGLRTGGGRPVRAVGVVRSIHPDRGNALLGSKHVPLRGRDYQTDRADGLSWRVSFGSFYQSHRATSAILYRPAMAMLGDLDGAVVIDGFAGVGALGLRVAQRGAKRVNLIESNAAACRDTEHNRAGIASCDVSVHNVAFDQADLPAADWLMVDPSRAGLGEVACRRILDARPARILYVACSPAALARDLRALVGGGYRATAARLVDLFPHTDHCEVLVTLGR